MIFSPEAAQAILEGRKTQARRLWKPGDRLIRSLPVSTLFFSPTAEVVSAGLRTRWAVSRSYAVQAGKKTVGHIRITGIRPANLQDITDEEVLAEGFTSRDAFIEDWNRRHKKKGVAFCWNSNPKVWVLEFEKLDS